MDLISRQSLSLSRRRGICRLHGAHSTLTVRQLRGCVFAVWTNRFTSGLLRIMRTSCSTMAEEPCAGQFERVETALGPHARDPYDAAVCDQSSDTGELEEPSRPTHVHRRADFNEAIGWIPLLPRTRGDEACAMTTQTAGTSGSTRDPSVIQVQWLWSTAGVLFEEAGFTLSSLNRVIGGICQSICQIPSQPPSDGRWRTGY